MVRLAMPASRSFGDRAAIRLASVGAASLAWRRRAGVEQLMIVAAIASGVPATST
jgi:hypothetical protein